jgi:hypothetical protein
MLNEVNGMPIKYSYYLGYKANVFTALGCEQESLRTTALKVCATVNSLYKWYTEHCPLTEVVTTTSYIMFLGSAISPDDCHYIENPHTTTFFYFEICGDK